MTALADRETQRGHGVPELRAVSSISTSPQNVAYGLKVQGVARAERDARVQEMLALVDLSALAQRSIDKLSGGQKQRVALARALAAQSQGAAV